MVQPIPPQKTILIVDDDPSVLRYVSDLMSGGNYNVNLANSGAEAVEWAGKYVGIIDLLLSDFQMPNMTGVEVASRICESRPNMKVLLMSGFSGGMLILNEGWHFLAKPFVPSQLRAIVVTILNDIPPFDAANSTPR